MIEDKLWLRRRNMSGVHLRAVVENRPMLTGIAFNDEGDEVVQVTGAAQEVFGQLQDILGFSYDLNFSPDRKWGSLLPNDSWTGDLLASRLRIGL